MAKDIDFLKNAGGPEDWLTDESLLTFHNVIIGAPPTGSGSGPKIGRLASVDRVNLIALTFAPGQVLRDHRSAHPITVQALTGVVDFTVGERTERLFPGSIVHLPEMLVHRLEAVEDSVVLLSMLTGDPGKES